MTSLKKETAILFSLAIFSCLDCSQNGDNSSDEDAGGGGDSDADSDSDSDVDSDSDANSDTDCETDSNTGGDTDTSTTCDEEDGCITCTPGGPSNCDDFYDMGSTPEKGCCMSQLVFHGIYMSPTDCFVVITGCAGGYCCLDTSGSQPVHTCCFD